jgi:hypothetical protein
MLSIPSKPKFFLLNALRFFSMLSLLFVFIANIIILAQDVEAIREARHDKEHEDCEYIEGSSVPNQPAGNFRAFLSIALNLLQCIVLFMSETGFPAWFFKNWIPCLDNEHSLVGVGVLEVLLAAQVMSHFLDPFPLVACFFLLIFGILNICTMYVDRPRFFRSYAFWKGNPGNNTPKMMESGRSPRQFSNYGSGPGSVFNEKDHPEHEGAAGYGFARNESILSRSVSSHSHGRANSPPTYSPPQMPVRLATKGGGRGAF